MDIKAVIFDLDGTITEPYFDFDAIRLEMGLAIDSGPILEAMEKMTPAQKDKTLKILHYHEQKAVDDSQLNDSAKPTLEKLKRKGLFVGIITRNTTQNTLAVAKKHGLTFDAIYSREDGPVKPDSYGVEFLCKKFSVKPNQTLVVGDYLFDLLCAKQCGAYSVLLENSKNADKFHEYSDFRIKKLNQLFDIIDDKIICRKN